MAPSGGGRARAADGRLVRLTLVLAAVLLRRAAPEFRRRYQQAALQHTEDVVRATYARGGAPALLALWPRLFWDLRTPTRPLPAPPERSASMLDTFVQDLRFARRAMARRPGSTALAVLILAVGIGASVAMFSVVDAVMLRPLPYPDSERIASLYLSIPEWLDSPALATSWRRTRWEYQEFVDWRARQRSFEQAGLMGRTSATLTGVGSGPAERVAVGMAGVGLFEVFAAVPQHGRLFAESDAAAPNVTVVAHAFWQSRLGADPGALGSSITLDGAPYFVIGVLPAGFEVSRVVADVWLPVFDNRPGGYFPGNTGDMNHVFAALGKLQEGVSPELAEAELARLLPDIGGEDHFTRHGASVVPRLADETRTVRAPMTLLMGAVLLLLVVACANVATVLLGQAVDRRQEMAVRSAIGAGHGRIVRQLLTESALLGMIAGAFGLVLARAGIAGLAELAPAYLPRLDAVALDLRAAGFAAAVSLLAGLLFGVAPALSLGRGRLARTLGSARSGSRSGSLLQSGMVVAEIALATVLLVGAGLLTRSFLRLNAVDPGFDAAGVVRLQLALDYGAFRTPEDQFDDAGVRARMDEIAAELRALPEVVDVAVSQSPPFSGYAANNNILPEGHRPQDGDFWLADRRFVTPGYFEVVGARLVEGRFLEPQDDRPDAASVVVITENIARRFWPGASAVGKRLGWWGQESIVVGVIEDVRDTSLADDPPMQFYAALAPFEQAGGSFLIGTRGAVEDLVTTVRNTTRRVAPNTPIMTLGRLDDAIAGSLDEARFRTRLIGLFALLAAILSVSGLYGVTSRAVAARVRELGVRVALGADRASVVGLVLRDGVRLAAIGALIGVAASIAGTRLLESFLYDIEPNDPLTLTLIVALVAGMAVLASLVPSLRASRVDPAEVLRAEA